MCRRCAGLSSNSPSDSVHWRRHKRSSDSDPKAVFPDHQRQRLIPPRAAMWFLDRALRRLRTAIQRIGERNFPAGSDLNQLYLPSRNFSRHSAVWLTIVTVSTSNLLIKARGQGAWPESGRLVSLFAAKLHAVRYRTPDIRCPHARPGLPRGNAQAWPRGGGVDPDLPECRPARSRTRPRMSGAPLSSRSGSARSGSLPRKIEGEGLV
jgi:hypothetical protein